MGQAQAYKQHNAVFQCFFSVLHFFEISENVQELTGILQKHFQ